MPFTRRHCKFLQLVPLPCNIERFRFSTSVVPASVSDVTLACDHIPVGLWPLFRGADSLFRGGIFNAFAPFRISSITINIVEILVNTSRILFLVSQSIYFPGELEDPIRGLVAELNPHLFCKWRSIVAARSLLSLIMAKRLHDIKGAAFARAGQRFRPGV